MSDSAPPTGGTAARRARLDEERQRTGTAKARRPRPGGGDRPGDGPRPDDVPSRPDERAARQLLDPDTQAALEEERDFLLGSLDDLEREHDAGDLDEADYQTLKDDYTARAATVIRALEDRDQARAAARRARARSSRGRAWVAVLVVVVLAVGAGVALAQASGRRAPGDTVSGDIRQSSRDKLLKAQEWTGEANTALDEGRGQDAVEAFRQALATYDDVLKSSPDNLEALTYQAWLYHQLALLAGQAGATDTDVAGLDQKAAAGLDRAIQVDPSYPDARVFRAILRRNAGDRAGALADLDAVPADQIPPMMRSMVDGLRQGLAGGTAGTAAPGSTVAP